MTEDNAYFDLAYNVYKWEKLQISDLLFSFVSKLNQYVYISQTQDHSLWIIFSWMPDKRVLCVMTKPTEMCAL